MSLFLSFSFFDFLDVEMLEILILVFGGNEEFCWLELLDRWPGMWTVERSDSSVLAGLTTVVVELAYGHYEVVDYPGSSGQVAQMH